MYLDNPSIVLVCIFSNKSKDDYITFKQLLNLLPLDKSHISQSLASNEKLGLIQKPEGSKYFTTIQITTSGIQKAQRHVAFLHSLLGNSSLEKEQKVKVKISFIDKVSTLLFSPLKATLKKSLQDYIPESHLTTDMLDDITDDILSFFQNKLEKFPQ